MTRDEQQARVGKLKDLVDGMELGFDLFPCDVVGDEPTKANLTKLRERWVIAQDQASHINALLIASSEQKDQSINSTVDCLAAEVFVLTEELSDCWNHLSDNCESHIHDAASAMTYANLFAGIATNLLSTARTLLPANDEADTARG